ncbi:hypothetical protein FPZ12_020170 [Amycolatopsis acidicola]|uniref:SAF domain-containing protein n=1 Tax=Amycolatopsis acidicola TaxID=2596893 RepID=A0A5N0V1E5_9PSEU|nr:SAF domain-containing protein [Amycolatopsis acidicola]KAA9159425.1 hypothetical protein FPZ12_020170 [Amycolatopsis acidicola]
MTRVVLDEHPPSATRLRHTEPFGRRWWRQQAIVAAVAVLLGGTNGFLLAQMDRRVPVLALTHPLSWGETIADADLAVIKQAPADGVSTISAKDRSLVLGRTTTGGTLPAGTVLAWGQLCPARHSGQGNCGETAPFTVVFP